MGASIDGAPAPSGVQLEVGADALGYYTVFKLKSGWGNRPAYEVAAIRGHKRIPVLKRYTHLRTEDLVAWVARVKQR